MALSFSQEGLNERRRSHTAVSTSRKNPGAQELPTASPPRLIPVRILFLCTGNICRSPFAEVLARQLNDRTDIEFASAGTIALGGNPASATGIAVAADLGVDMSNHRTTHLTTRVLQEADLVYAMEDEHIASVLALDPGARVELLSPEGAPMPDPYGGDRFEYERSYHLIAVAIGERLAELASGPGAARKTP